ncbi:saccharopepsin [Ranunculus cassubicifolius]
MAIVIRYSVLLLIFIISRNSHGFETFGFDFHHRFSDPVKGVLTVDELPDKGTTQYYAVMAHRDRVIHARRLASGDDDDDDDQQLTFRSGNLTVQINSLGL